MIGEVYSYLFPELLENGALLKFAPEYEECALIAREKNIPLREIYDSVNETMRKKFAADR